VRHFSYIRIYTHYIFAVIFISLSAHSSANSDPLALIDRIFTDEPTLKHYHEIFGRHQEYEIYFDRALCNSQGLTVNDWNPSDDCRTLVARRYSHEETSNSYLLVTLQTNLMESYEPTAVECSASESNENKFHCSVITANGVLSIGVDMNHVIWGRPIASIRSFNHVADLDLLLTSWASEICYESK